MESRFCQECGAPLNEGAKFCDKCGSPIAQDNKEEITEKVEEKESANGNKAAQIVIATPDTVVTKNKGKDNKTEKKSNSFVGVLIAALILIALIFAILIKTNVITLNLGKNETSLTQQETSSETQSETSTTQTTTESTTETTTAATTTTTANSIASEIQTPEDTQRFLTGMTLGEIKERYAGYNWFPIPGGASVVEPMYSDGTTAENCALFEGDPATFPDRRSFGIYVYKDGANVFGETKIGDSIEQFKKANDPNSIEIAYDEESESYICTAEIIGVRGYRVQMYVSDSQGSKIEIAYITMM